MQLLANKKSNQIGLIGHTIIDYPDHQSALAVIDKLVANQVDLIELQIPFSEPIADGPVFTKANHQAILNGVTLKNCFDFMATVTQKYTIPFVFMTYANIIFKLGFENFVQKSKAAGASGAIVPDLPLDVAKDYLAVCQANDFAAIPVVSPNISDQRLSEIAPLFDGFIYAVARAGVTGHKTEFGDALFHYLNRLRNHSNLPIAVGFGIASGEDLNLLRGKADYAVVGTQTLRAFEQEGIAGVEKLWQALSHNK